MSSITNVSRRRFLKGLAGAGALVLGAYYVPKALRHPNSQPGRTEADRATLHPNAFVGIDTDGTVFIVAHRSEMGTAIRTTLPMVVADELDADWKRIEIDQAIGDSRYGDQNTDGSHSVRSFFDVMRQAGATARSMLILAAAQKWGVAPTECQTDLHAVVHSASGRRLGCGELATAASKLPIPKSGIRLKTPEQWRYIGKGMTSYDLAELCTGRAIYGEDVRVNGMVFASIEHPPVIGGKVTSVDDSEALKVAGVQKTVRIDPFKPPPGFQPLGGIAVISDNTWAAFQGRKKLKIEWDNGPNATYDSEQYKKKLQATAREAGKIVRNQ